MKRISIINFLCVFALFTYAQQKTSISGLVKDKTTGEPLIGANIVAGKHQNGTTTDAYDFYSLQVEQNRPIKISTSYVG